MLSSATLPRDDTELVGAVRAGNLASFEILVERYHDPLLRYLGRLTGDPDEAADLTQATFVEAFRCLDRLKRDDRFAAWLYGIAHNRLHAEWRRRRLRRMVSLQWLPHLVMEALPALRVEGEAEAAHERDLVQRTLDELSPTLRQALLLYGVGGFTSREVADILGISIAAAERRISRAKLRFRHLYRAAEGGGNVLV